MTMHVARSIVERIVIALIRLAAFCLIAAAVALIVPIIALQVAGAEALRIVTGDLLQLAIAFAFAGSITLYFARWRTRWLPDGPVSQASAGSGFDGWLIFFPLTLVSASVLMLVWLQPLAEFWRDVLALADRLDLWQNLQGDLALSGLVLMPVIGALAIPGVEVLAAVSCVCGSALLLALLLLRSTRVPRALIVCVLIQGSLVLASVFGVSVIERLTPPVEQLIRETPDPGGMEQARATAAFQRYRVVTRGASETLTWTWGAFAVWAPLLLLSARSRSAFFGAGSLQDDPTIGAPVRIDLANVNAMDERTRAREYVNAARQVDEATPPSRPF